MADAHKNFAYSTVATAPSPATSGTSLVVAAGGGVLFPTPPFNATIWPAGAQPLASNAEIVRVTGIATDTLTIVRAQEGSSARSVVVGDQIAATITTKTLTDLELGWFNVRSYGAVGDSTTDDSAAIQAAVNAAVNALNSGLSATVYFPTGQYYVATGITSTHAGVTFVGDGSPGISTALASGSTQIIVGNGQWGFTLGSTSSSNFRGPRIENIEFYEKNAGLALGGVRTYRIGNGRYVNCAFGPFTQAVASTFNGTPGTLTSLGTTLTLASTTGWLAGGGSGRIATSGTSKLHSFTYTGVSGSNLTGVAYNGGSASDTVAAAAAVTADVGIGFLNDGIGDNAPYNYFENCRFGTCTVGYLNRLANGTRMVGCTHDGANNGTAVTTGSIGVLVASGDTFRAHGSVLQGYDKLMWFAKANNGHQVDGARWEIWKTVAVQLDGDNGTNPSRIQGSGDNSLLSPGGDTGFIIGSGVVGAWIQAMMMNTATVYSDSGTNSTIQIQNTSSYVNTGPLAAGGLALETSTVPTVDGVAAVGARGTASDSAHVHPTDTTRAPAASPTFTGTVNMSGATVTLPSGIVIPSGAVLTTQSPLDNSTKGATTAYADAAVAVETARAEAAEALLAPLIAPGIITCNANIGPFTGAPAAFSNSLKPQFYPITAPVGSYDLSALALRLTTQLASSSVGLAVYSIVYSGSGTYTATLVCQLNAAIDTSVSPNVLHGDVTSGSAGSGAGVVTLDFASNSYIVGHLPSTGTTLACQGTNVVPGLGALNWTTTARSSTTDWPSSFTQASAPAVTVQHLKWMAMLTADGKNWL